MAPRSGPDGSYERGFRITAGFLLGLLLVTWALPRLAPGRSTAAAYDAVWPQRWAFFANAPESAVLVAYRGRPGTGMEPITRVTMAGWDLWGLSRTNEPQGVETREVAAGLPATAWVVCSGEPDNCAGSALPSPVTNLSRRPTLCGPVILTVEVPQRPPAVGSARRVAELAAADVRCPG